ncbi:hypothetical protein VP01_2598g1 [Puccinia sorghi]|uniref:Retrotransposon gag domain-containing protein n=1 Tax=Puccinia sorghi TaxID=27349 RepID=A0A0L6V6H5_9BASI|nr:hypothetical protein VP01_2598g1 [Puccinia sorghi]
MLTNLSGNTTKWAQPLNQRVLNKSDPDRKGKAQKALRTFNKSGNVESYTQQFNIHAYDSSWSDDILHSQPSPTSRPWPSNLPTNLKPTAATLSK